MKLEYQEYRPRKIINVHKHVDGPWFWNKYSAHPYIGCRSGCEFCYCRGYRYLGRRDPDTFDTLIKVKTNALDLFRKELARLEPDVIAAGDWQQPAEDRYQLSRGMLDIVREQKFPLFVVERSPLLTRDLDLLIEINRQSWVGVLFSMSNLDPTLKQAFEPRSPGIKRRFQAMETLAEAGIYVGTSLMPVLPIVGDSKHLLEEVIVATKAHGGQCVLAGGLTMDGVQANRTLAAARQFDPALEGRWRKFYNWQEDGKPQYGPTARYRAGLGLRVRELCHKYGLQDRMPRYIAPGPLAINKRIAERLFLRIYDLELEQSANHRIWAYRKAAWTIDELPDSIADIIQKEGAAGLEKLPHIGKSLAAQMMEWAAEVR